MYVYILDNLYRPVELIDRFESMIWTERMRAYGDFEFHVPSTLQNRSRFTPGTRLAINESYRVMTLETYENYTDDQGRKALKLTGSSLEKILDDRAALGSLTDLTSNPKWVLTGTPTAIARQVFHDICVTGTLDVADKINGIIEASIFPEDTIAEPTESITVEFDPTTVYQIEKAIGEAYGIGFRLVRDPSSNLLYWDVYVGSDRTTSQSTLPAVVFSPELENLQNTRELTSTALYKNVAYVISPVGHEVVYAEDVDPSISSFERRVLIVSANDINDTDSSIASAKMIQKGKEELAKNRELSAFDGEINQYSQYKYGIDYNLGDLVEQRNQDGVANHMQVTEQIIVSDSEGERSYPTLSVNKFITPGSWAARPYDQVWVDVPDTEHWADL